MNGLVVLIPYTTGQDFYGEWDDGCEATTSYLPIFIETLEKDSALMTAAYAACVDYRYVAFPSSNKTSQEWEIQGYSGTLEEPAVELPNSEEAFEILDPGDCFCCASLEDYLVISIEEMLEQVQNSPYDFISSQIFPSEEDRRRMWIEFNDWSIRKLSDSIFDEE
ncbi:hypothetical protein NDA01_13825 [Trichocoleus desertorum AS-A10]|uniref:hypothetical protein n=1 Tax=Trichocoleus desertorum TaxID=1481672 RepID=UPI00329A5E59